MDSHGFCFGQFATSARVGSGDGVDLAASGSSAAVSGRRVCCTRLVSSLRRHRAPGCSGQAPSCGAVACLAQAVMVLWHHHLTVP